MLGTFLTVLIVYSGRHWSYLNAFGAFACGCLASAIAFFGITYPHVTERYRQLRRFEKLRYGYSVPSVAFIGPGALLALVWLAYVVLHV